MNSDLIKQYIFAAIRYGLPYAAAYLAAKVGITTDQAAAWIGTTTTIAMFIWSLANKTHYETKVNTALDLPKGSSKDTLKDVIAEGNATSATASK